MASAPTGQMFASLQRLMVQEAFLARCCLHLTLEVCQNHCVVDQRGLAGQNTDAGVGTCGMQGRDIICADTLRFTMAHQSLEKIYLDVKTTPVCRKVATLTTAIQ